MADLDGFRRDVIAWLEAAAPPSLRGRRGDPEFYSWGGKKERRTPEVDAWLQAAIERGYTAPTWPRQYGGATAHQA